MKITKDTLTVLKNFATVSTNLYIREGAEQSTKNPSNSVLAVATLEQEFPSDFGIYDLPQFLGLLSLYEDPEITFEDKSVILTQNNATTVYYAADPAILIYPTKKVNMPAPQVEFALPAAEMAKVIKTAGILSAETIYFEGVDGKLFLVVAVKTSETSKTNNKFKIELGDTDQEFKAFMKLANLKMLPLDYNVSISSKGICRFVSVDNKITYFVALETTSTF